MNLEVVYNLAFREVEYPASQPYQEPIGKHNLKVISSDTENRPLCYFCDQASFCCLQTLSRYLQVGSPPLLHAPKPYGIRMQNAGRWHESCLVRNRKTMT